MQARPLDPPRSDLGARELEVPAPIAGQTGPIAIAAHVPRSGSGDGNLVEGNKGANAPLNGGRGAGIYLYRSFGTTIRGCVVRNFRGDGISFHQSNDVTVVDCVSEDNADLGLHPGSGSQRPVVKKCVARNNGTDGLFQCWRVRHGIFEDNRLEGNGRLGISIGHKDSDNLLRGNQVVRNVSNCVCFRNESVGMTPHLNRPEGNRIEDDGREPGTAGIRIGGEPTGLVFEGNVIRDTREGAGRTQAVGILVEGRVGPVTLGSNEIEASPAFEDRRRGASGADSPK
jgi:parallel beta-helix repeat protein